MIEFRRHSAPRQPACGPSLCVSRLYGQTGCDGSRLGFLSVGWVHRGRWRRARACRSGVDIFGPYLDDRPESAVGPGSPKRLRCSSPTVRHGGNAVGVEVSWPRRRCTGSTALIVLDATAEFTRSSTSTPMTARRDVDGRGRGGGGCLGLRLARPRGGARCSVRGPRVRQPLLRRACARISARFGDGRLAARLAGLGDAHARGAPAPPA